MVWSVSEPIEKPKKQCLLTSKGIKKLQDAGIDDYTNKDLSGKSGLDRGTVAKIRKMVWGGQEQKAVAYKSLNDLFSSLNLDLEEDDFKNQQQTSPKRTKPKPHKSLPESPKEKLLEVLRELNYKKQKSVFEDAIEQVKPAATFLIYGKSEQLGQKWLVNQLFKRVPYSDNVSCWKEPFRITPRDKDIQSIRRNLANKIGCSPTSEAIIEQLYNYWQSATVVLVLYDIDLMVIGQSLRPFLEEIWHPLVKQVNQANPEIPYRLLLFLVDHKNSKSKWERVISTLEKPDRNQSGCPQLLKELQQFTWDEVETWVGIQSKLLLELWPDSAASDLQIRTIMKEIFERDQQPRAILKDICSCFDLDWDIDIERSLTL